MKKYSDGNEIPVFVINGFLEAGKTSFVRYTIEAPYFRIKGRTLLLVCEEGEIDYPERLLKRNNVVMISAGSKEELSADFFDWLNDTYEPERVIIEYNGMWGDPAELETPVNWALFQQVTVVDGSTLSMYLANMKPLMGPMLKNSELCIVNRCDGLSEEKLIDMKRKLRPMLLLPGAAVEMETENGPIDLMVLPEELPFDVSGSVVRIPDESYGIWFIDARDYPERYIGKKVSFRARIMKNRFLGPTEFVPVRMVMTCCEADMQPLGYIASYPGIGSFADGDWVEIEAVFRSRYRKEYEGEGPFLEVDSLVHTGPAAGPCGF